MFIGWNVASLGFEPSEEMRKEIKEKGYMVIEDVWHNFMNTGEWRQGKGDDDEERVNYYQLHIILPDNRQHGVLGIF